MFAGVEALGAARRNTGTHVTEENFLAQFNIIHGSADENGPYTRALHSEGSSPESVNLYLVTEATSPDSASLCRSVADTICESFTSHKLSLTAGLRDSLKVVHDQMVRENRDSLPEHRVGIEAACAVIKDDQLYLAQAGSTAIFIANGNGVTQISPPPEIPSTALIPLGLSAELPVRLKRYTLPPGSAVIFATSNLNRLVGEGELDSLVQEGLYEAVIEVYRRARDEPYFGFIAVVPQWPEGDPGMRQETAGPGGPVAQGDGVTVAESFLPRARPFQPPLFTDDSVEWPQGLGIRLREPPRWTSRYNPPLYQRRSTLLVAGAALLALMLAGWMWLRPGMGSAEGDRSRLLAQAEALYRGAEGAVTASSSREALQKARSKVEEALKTEPHDPRAATLLDSLNSRLSELDGLHNLGDVRQMVDFRTVSASFPVLRDLVRGVDRLYILDRASDRVYEYPIAGDGSGRSGVIKPLNLGDRLRGVNLTHILWMPRGGLWNKDALLLLDERRHLYEYLSDGEVRELPLRGAEEWASLASSAGYGGNLYVLDSMGSQVWRYVPTDLGYDSERKGVLGGVDLRDAVDLALDGDIYVLQRGGAIIKFSGGLPRVLSQDGIDRPLSNPVAIVTAPGTRYVYVVDRGNVRIVRYDKDGVFKGQLVAPSIGAAYDLYPDEKAGLVYILTDTGLYSASLPAEEAKP